MDSVRNNRAFWRALHGLTHNVCLAAICALLANDHFLRIRFPSWLTGKLGDFAWLVFAPFICALAFSWLVRGRRQEALVGAASFGFIGLWFALAKTVPFVNGWTIDALAWLLGYRGAMRLDATDLLTLPGLWIGWRVWRRADHRPEMLKSRAWLFVGLGVMATVATSQAASPHHGIGRLCGDGRDLYALEYPLASPHGYVSHDRGETWTSAASIENSILDKCGMSLYRGYDGKQESRFSLSPYQNIGIVSDGQRQYRIADGGEAVIPDSNEYQSTNNTDRWQPQTLSSGPLRLQRSSDAGATWQDEFDLSGLGSQSRFELNWEDGHDFDPGPRDALIGPNGVVVMAMGTDGLLVRPETGIWAWKTVGGYRYRKFGFDARIKMLLWRFPPYIYPGSLLPTLIFIALAVLTIGNINPPELWKRAFAVAGWLLFALSWLPIPPVSILTVLIMSVLFPGELLLAVIAARRVYRLDPNALVTLLGLSALAGSLYFFPLVLWAFDTVPSYPLAHFYGLGLGAAAVVSGRLYIRRRYRMIFDLPLRTET